MGKHLILTSQALDDVWAGNLSTEARAKKIGGFAHFSDSLYDFCGAHVDAALRVGAIAAGGQRGLVVQHM